MTSIIRVGQSKFVTVPIDEDSHERILNCIQTLSELEERPAVHEIFLKDTKAAYTKMLGAQEVSHLIPTIFLELPTKGFQRLKLPNGKKKRLRKPLLSKWTTSSLSDNSPKNLRTTPLM